MRVSSTCADHERTRVFSFQAEAVRWRQANYACGGCITQERRQPRPSSGRTPRRGGSPVRRQVLSRFVG